MRVCVAVVLAATALAVAVPAAPAAADTIREAQWHLDAVKATQAHQISRGDGVVVAVIDTGVDASHPDLAGGVLPGRSFVAGQDAQTDTVGHGTAMAGLIAARGGGPNQALGLAPGARILPVAIAQGITTQTLAEPIRWAVDNGARVINLSTGRDLAAPSPPDEAEAVAYAQANDVVVVVSAGNTSDVTVGNAFAALPGVIGVSGIARSGGHLAGTSTGPFVAVSAPGEDVATTYPTAVANTGYAFQSGSSQAAAIVSGVAALIRARYPDMDAANVVNRIIASAVDQGTPGRDDEFGFGAVDAERALSMDIPAVTENPLGVAAPVPGEPDGSGGPSDGSGARALVLIGLLVTGLLCVGLVIAVAVWLTTRSRRRPPPGPPHAGPTTGAPQPYAPQPHPQQPYPQQFRPQPPPAPGRPER